MSKYESAVNDGRDSEGDENDPYGNDPAKMRVSAEFLKNLPGVETSDSMGYRIEALRVYLETKLGEQAFIAAYRQ